MRTDQNKSPDVSLETELDGRQNVKAVFVKGTVRNLTTLDIIGLAVLTMFLPALSLEQLTDGDNPRQKPEDEQETIDKQS